MDINNRYKLVTQKISEKKFDRLGYFAHIPKTGGQTLTKNLIENCNETQVLSMDASDENFSHMLDMAFNSSCKSLLIRSHHPFRKLQCLLNLCDYFYSFYRDPVSIYMSNFNMLMRRFDNYITHSESMNVNELEYVKRWEKILLDNNVALENRRMILNEEFFVSITGNFFKHMFTVEEAVSFVKNDKSKIYRPEHSNHILQSQYGQPSSTIENKNVSFIKYANREDLSPKTYSHLENNASVARVFELSLE